MKRLFVAIWGVLVVTWSSAPCQTEGRLVLASDAAGTDCRVVDTTPGTIEVHMVIQNVDGVAAVQFGAPKPDCWTGAVWVEDRIAFPVAIGDTQFNDPRGLSIGLGACMDSPVYLGSIVYSTQGEAIPCCPYKIVKVPTDLHPEIDGPIMVVCPAMNSVVGLSSGAVINVDPECDCMSPLPVREATWGSVKSLFGDQSVRW
jgi:hypothetical protein